MGHNQLNLQEMELRLLQNGIGRLSAPVRAVRPEKRRESIGTIFSLTGFSNCLWRRTSRLRELRTAVSDEQRLVWEFTTFERLTRTKLSETRCAKRIKTDEPDPALSLSILTV